MEKIKEVKLKLHKIGSSEEWLLSVNLEESQERGWLIGRKKEVNRIIKILRNL